MAVASGHPPRCLCRCQWADAARRAPRGATGWHGATDIIYSSARLGEKTLTTDLAAPWNVRPEAWNRGPWSVWTGQAGRSFVLAAGGRQRASRSRGCHPVFAAVQLSTAPCSPQPMGHGGLPSFARRPPRRPESRKNENTLKLLLHRPHHTTTTQGTEARRRSEGVKRYASCPCFLEWDSRQAHRRATSHCCPEARASAAHATFLTLCGESLS